MSQDKVILATTEVIDGVMLTRESLVYAVATINGEKALRQIVDHDPCSIPLVLQRRFLDLVSVWAEIAPQNARAQSCQACGLIAMRMCSRVLSCEPSL